MGRKRDKAPEVPRIIVPCAFEPCPDPAICRIRVREGWASVCFRHYVAHYAQLARDWCLDRGLDTKAKCKEYIFKSRFNFVMREPGADG